MNPNGPLASSIPVSPGDRPCLPKLCGADMELGNFILGAVNPAGTCSEASRALLREIDGFPGQPLVIPANSSYVAHPASAFAALLGPETDPLYDPQDWGRKYLLNGGAAYIDLDHLEMCVPETLSAFDHLAACHAMFRLAWRAAQTANLRLPAGQSIQVLANNSDGRGNSYGSHENFLVRRETWENIFHRRIHHLQFLAAYQASSLIFTGQGKVGSENLRAPVPFQISQRADFFEVLVGEQTTYRRPIVNSRDEPLCGGPRAGTEYRPPARELARLHVIFYDNNLCHTATVLKTGVMQCILALLEAGWVNATLALDDPVDAVVRWSHDPTLCTRARLVSGALVTAIELQRAFLREAERFAQAGGFDGIVPRAREILDLWADTLAKLQAGDFPALARRLDWVLKWSMLQQAIGQQPELDWTSPQIKYLDHLYSSLDPAQGLYWACERRGLVDRLVTDADVGLFVNEPPENTRAWTRAALLRLARRDEVDLVDWDHIRFRVRPPGGFGPFQYRVVDLGNPLMHTKAQMGNLLAGVDRLDSLWPVLPLAEHQGAPVIIPPTPSPLTSGASPTLTPGPAKPLPITSMSGRQSPVPNPLNP